MSTSLFHGFSARGPARHLVTAALLVFITLFAGCKDDLAGGMLVDCDLTPPLTGSISPTCGSSGVALNQFMSATFTEDVDPVTVNAGTVTLMTVDGTMVAGEVGFSTEHNVVSFTPSSNLAPFATYSYTIKGGSNGIRDLFGNSLLNDFVCTFTTGPAPDTTAPTVTVVSPTDGSTDVVLNSVVMATFSEAMDPLSITASTFTLLGPGTTQVAGSVTYAGPSATAVFHSTDALLPATSYTATIAATTTDLVGNPLAVAYVWTFTTGAAMDTTAPFVVSTQPLHLEADVVRGANVMATFSEAMDQATISSSFTVMNGITPVAGSVSYSGMVAMFNPTNDFMPGTTYTATVSTDATDLAGISMVSARVWTFTTAAAAGDTTAPEVTSTNPADLAVDVAINADVTASFSEAMNPTTISGSTFALKEGTISVPGSVSYLGTTATFNPTSDLKTGTTYTATVTTGAEDVAGNPLATEYEWTFTTADPVGPIGPMAVDLGCAAGNAVLAGATITSTGPSIINGDVAMSPGSALIGFPPGVINGVVHINDTTADNAKGCLTVAYNDAAGRAPGAAVSGNIGGLTLAPGVYTAGSGLAISSGDLTLDAQGDANGVFIFQIPTSLTVTAGRQVFLVGGAQAKNVFWQVGSSATIGTTAIMMGTIMADQAITLETGATLNGAALARIAAVSLDAATINVQ